MDLSTLPLWRELLMKNYEHIQAKKRVIRTILFSAPIFLQQKDKIILYRPGDRLSHIIRYHWTEVRWAPWFFFRHMWSRIQWHFLSRRMRRDRAAMLYLGNVRRTRLASEPLTQFRAAKLAAESTLALGKREFEEMKVEADDFKSKSEDYTRQISRLPSSISERQRQKLIQTNNELASKQKSINRRYRDLIVAHGSLRDRSKLAYGLTRRVLRSWTSQ